ncbi:hypothetical protein ACJX0J_041203, partial [Zea mays]
MGRAVYVGGVRIIYNTKHLYALFENISQKTNNKLIINFITFDNMILYNCLLLLFTSRSAGITYIVCLFLSICHRNHAYGQDILILAYFSTFKSFIFFFRSTIDTVDMNLRFTIKNTMDRLEIISRLNFTAAEQVRMCYKQIYKHNKVAIFYENECVWRSQLFYDDEMVSKFIPDQTVCIIDGIKPPHVKWVIHVL